jgi:hypothetical protein
MHELMLPLHVETGRNNVIFRPRICGAKYVYFSLLVYFYVLGDQELLYFNIQLDTPFSPYNILGDILFSKYFSARLSPNCCPQLTVYF